MKKLTAGIFATILGLTAMGAADAASNVASTAYVKGAIESLDSEKAADEGKYISSIKMVDGKISTIGEKALPTVDGFKTELDSSASAQAGYAVTGVTMTDGALTVSETKLFTNDDRDSAKVTATAGKYISGVSMTDGALAIEETLLPEDKDTTYKAGKFVNIDENNVITTLYEAGDNINIDTEGVISAILPTTADIQGGINMATASAEEGYAVKSVAVTNGQLVVTETAKLFTNNDRDSDEVAATEGKVLSAVSMSDGKLAIKETALPTVAGFKAELDGTADAGTQYLLQSVTLTNGELAAGTKVEIVDSYPDTSLPLTPAI
jgi:hypothetical protein